LEVAHARRSLAGALAGLMMIRRFLKIVMIVTAALAVLVASVLYAEFFRFQAAVDQVIGSLPPEERDISPPAVRVFEKLDGPMIPWLATRGLLTELRPLPVSQGRWHLLHGFWGSLLPLRVARHDMVSLYAHYMAFEGGDGLLYGARHYYAKKPAELDLEEAVALVTISRGPERFSPQRHQEQYEAMYRKLLAQCRAAG
jgi:hypothetical protein